MKTSLIVGRCVVAYRSVPCVWLLKPRLHDTTCCHTGCETGLTTGWIIVYTIQPVVKPVWQPVWQPVVSCKRGSRVTRGRRDLQRALSSDDVDSDSVWVDLTTSTLSSVPQCFALFGAVYVFTTSRAMFACRSLASNHRLHRVLGERARRSFHLDRFTPRIVVVEKCIKRRCCLQLTAIHHSLYTSSTPGDRHGAAAVCTEHNYWVLGTKVEVLRPSRHKNRSLRRRYALPMQPISWWLSAEET